MGHYNYVLLDIETGPDTTTARIHDSVNEKQLIPEDIGTFKDYKKARIKEEQNKVYAKNYSKQETIDKHLSAIKDINFKEEFILKQDEQKNQIQKLALNHPFAFIKFVTIIVNTNGKEKVLFASNFDNDIHVEKNIIEKVTTKIHKLVTGESGKPTHELVTYNGKHFDIPLLIERGGVTNARIPFRWLENLIDRGNRFGHYDMIEKRSYLNSPYNKLSLSSNLAIRYGIDFAKEEIDFSECNNKELAEYALDEALKFSYWIKDHNNVDVPDIKDYLKYIDKTIKELLNTKKV